MKKVIYSLLTLLVLSGCVKEMHEEPPSEQLKNASTLLPQARENARDYFRATCGRFPVLYG